MTVPGNINALLLGGQRGYQIERSLRFNSADSAYLNRTPASAGNRKTWTWSGWVKRGKLGGTFGLLEGNAGVSDLTAINTSSDTLSVQDYSAGVPYNLLWTTTAVYRDPSAWYHIVVAYDTTQASSSNTVKIYINGTAQVVTFTAVQGSYSQNRDSYINTTVAQRIGVYNGLANYFDGYLTEINFIDGQALTPSSFGETDIVTGVWKPKKYTGTYGTNGFYLKFADNSGTTSTTLGKDSSGNGNNWTPNNFSVTAGAGNDSLIDTPTPYADGGNGRGNYATLSPLTLGTSCSLTNGNLDAGWTSVAVRVNTQSNFGIPTSGKWYWEVTLATNTNGNATFGVVGAGYSPTAGDVGDPASGYALAPGLGGSTSMMKRNNNSNTSWGAATTSFGASVTYGIAVNMDTGSIFFRDATGWMNASNSNDSTPTTAAYTGLSGTYVPAVGHYSVGSQSTAFNLNFGQRAFAYTPPSGFLALNTQNLPEPSIKKPSSYMDVAIQTGNTTGRTVSGLAFQPDLVWVKNRAGSANRRWGLIDSVRGVNKTLASDRTDAEVTSQTDLLTAFNSDGFTIGADAGLYGWNGFVESYAHFVWKKSATPGFDIVTFTGNGSAPATISHSLGVAPSMMIVKNRDQVGDWVVYHSSITNSQTGGIFLNLTNAWGANSTYFNNSVPTSSNFQVGSYFTGNNIKYVAYLWSEVAGFSKFGSYTGNGSSDGPFVFCGFRPRWIMFKSTTLATDWIILDAARDPYNQQINGLGADISNAENASTLFATDALSNGFKLRTSWNNFNQSGQTFIFAAFAESPQKYSLAR